MTRLVLTPVPGEPSPCWPVLVAVADDLGSALTGIAAGADVIDLGDATAADIAAFEAAAPDVPFCAAAGRAAVTWQAASAINGSAILICPDLASARATGLPAERLVILVPPAGIALVADAGYAAMVDADQAAAQSARAANSAHRPSSAEVAGSVAAAALSSWLGAALVRTRYPMPVRRALDMAATVRGDRPPARTVRGLA